MDAETLESRLREEYEIELSRLGSSKALYALTGGELDASTVRAAMAADAAAAERSFEPWADDADGPAADLFARAAADARDHRAAADTGPADADPAPYGRLSDFEGLPERLGGFLARTLVLERTVGQAVGFFVGNADPDAADAFRTVRVDVEDQLAAARDALDAACEDGDDWERAETAAAATVEAAYDDYVETLESMGVKPKNVC